MYANLEAAQAVREDVDAANRVFVSRLGQDAQLQIGDSYPNERAAEILARYGPEGAFQRLVADWAGRDARPLILLLDEVDSLIGDSLVSLLRQLRAGYPGRPAAFPQSVVLCGVRDIHDYRIHSSREKQLITGGSAFNIKAESMRLGDFTEREVRALYLQHTAETGQLFEEAAIERAWALTRGQPWLVNALAHECTWRLKEGRDRTRPVTLDMIERAKERLIVERVTHIDQLGDKLREDRVRRVIQPMLQGVEFGVEASRDEISYTIDLGLVRRGADGLEIANPIYREVIPRYLTEVAVIDLESTQKTAWYVDGGTGGLLMEKLLGAFQQFFREHSEHWVERFDYKEAGPQLLLQAFLQRVVNGGGRIEREYGLGRKRTDLLVIWPARDGVLRYVLELKVARGAVTEALVQEGLDQTAEYLQRVGLGEGHLVLFDRSGRSWDEKIGRQSRERDGRVIHVWTM